LPPNFACKFLTRFDGSLKCHSTSLLTIMFGMTSLWGYDNIYFFLSYECAKYTFLLIFQCCYNSVGSTSKNKSNQNVLFAIPMENWAFPFVLINISYCILMINLCIGRFKSNLSEIWKMNTDLSIQCQKQNIKYCNC
jgi:hypothetical protein